MDTTDGDITKLLVEAVAAIETYCQGRLERITTEATRLVDANHRLIAQCIYLEDRLDFLEVQHACQIKHQSALLIAKDTEISVLKSRLQNSQGDNAKDKVLDSNAQIVVARESQLERLAGELESSVNNYNRQVTLCQNHLAEMNHLRMTIASLNTDLSNMKEQHDKMTKSIQANDRAVGFKRLLSSASIPMLIQLGAGNASATTSVGNSTSGSSRVGSLPANDAPSAQQPSSLAVCEFLADLRAEIQVLLDFAKREHRMALEISQNTTNG